MLSIRILDRLLRRRRGYQYGSGWTPSQRAETTSAQRPGVVLDNANPLREFFETHREGRGIWKWLHYFEIYHRHLQKFIGKEVHVLEIGVFSGGSLEMWKSYFGPKVHIYGVDIAPGCKVYDDAQTKIFIGDQASREFWAEIKEHIPFVDVVIDDGGHEPEQQVVTLEEILTHIRPGGVYLCEDIHGSDNGFAAYVNGLAMNLNGAVQGTWNTTDAGTVAKRTPFQREIESIHLYPFVAVVEKAAAPVDDFVSEKHGTQWKPYEE